MKVRLTVLRSVYLKIKILFNRGRDLETLTKLIIDFPSWSIKSVDVSCGGENGFNQAIEFSLEILSNVKSVKEKRLIGKFLEEVSQDDGKLVYGLDDTMKVLEMGAFQTVLIIWEDLDINRILKQMSTSNSAACLRFSQITQRKDQILVEELIFIALQSLHSTHAFKLFLTVTEKLALISLMSLAAASSLEF
ncbi:hypothetical protein NC652_000781 [Populus alba x Populus x berolinensis]|nr:hypothetical protein NC652_000781 [Populus alba x Populus x berolinensis]